MIVTDESFDQAIKENKTILIDFWADWCGPCRKVAPILEELSTETGLLVGKLNIDENQKKPQEYSVRGVCVWTRDFSESGRGVWGCVPIFFFVSPRNPFT